MKVIVKILSVLLLLIANNIYASDKQFLTVEQLIANGYQQLDGSQLSRLLKEAKIEIRDIETQAVSISTRSTAGSNTRASEAIKKDEPLYFLDTRLLARAPSLSGTPEYKVSGDKLIATDGVRTYHIRFYEREGKMYGARDIDNGNVFFEIVGR